MPKLFHISYFFLLFPKNPWLKDHLEHCVLLNSLQWRQFFQLKKWSRWSRCGSSRYSQGESGDGQVTIGGFGWAWRWLRSRGLLILSGDSLWASASFQSFYCANTTDDCSAMCSTAFTYRSTQHRDQYSALESACGGGQCWISYELWALPVLPAETCGNWISWDQPLNCRRIES